MMQARIKELFGFGVEATDAGHVDAAFVPAPEAANPFEAAVLAGQAGCPELRLQVLFAEVLAGTRTDGGGDVFCPAFAPGSPAAVVEWIHDEPLSWDIAARSFAELDAMYDVVAELEALGVDEDVRDEIADAAGESETRSEWFAAIEDEGVRAAIARWPDAPPPRSYDFGTWNDVVGHYCSSHDPTSVASLACTRLRQAAWVVAGLAAGEVRWAPPDEVIGRELDALSARDTLGVGEQLYALWASWFTGRDVLARQLCGRGLESPSSLVRGAAALVARALDGDTTIGGVDLGPVRAALVARAVPRPGVLSADEVRAGRAAVRAVLMPSRTEWNPGYLEYTNLEVLETSIEQVPPEIGGLRKLRRFRCSGVVPEEIAQLAELEELACTSVPPSVAALTKLRALSLRWAEPDALATIAGLVNLEEVELCASSDVILSDSWSALTRLRSLSMTATGKTQRVHLSAAIAALPALESLYMRGEVDELPEDWSHARALREVTIHGRAPANLGVLATAPALRTISLHAWYKTPIPDLSAFAELDRLRVKGDFRKLSVVARAIHGVGKLRRLEYGGRTVVKGKCVGLPEELLGVDVEELSLEVPEGARWGDVERLARSIPRLRSLALVEVCRRPAEPVDAELAASGWPGLESLDLRESWPPTPMLPNLRALPDVRELVLGRADDPELRVRTTDAFLDGLASCARLEVARLAGVALRPEDVTALASSASLRELDLARCGITGLPDRFAARSPLTMLDLRNNPLVEIPASIGALPLRVLRLGGTRIASLDALPAPTGLEHLDLASPALARVPAWLCELVHLRRLELGGPAIDLEHALALACELPQLRELVIRGVHWPGIPPSLLRMKHLERLELFAVELEAPLIQVRVQLPNTTLVLD